MHPALGYARYVPGERLGSGCRISSPAGLADVYSPSLNSVPRMPPRFN